MRYPAEVREKAIRLYQEGTPRSQIAEQMEIPLATIRSWTKEIVSIPLSFIKCKECGKKKRTLNIQQEYCSPSCKNRASYLRRLEKERLLESRPHQICQHCEKQYQPAHRHATKYCSKKCSIKASNDKRRRKLEHARFQKEQARRREEEERRRIELEQTHIDTLIEKLLKAKGERDDLKIDGHKYREEIDFVTEYRNKNRQSLSEVQEYKIQDIFKSVRY